MTDTLYAQLCDVLDLYRSGEFHISDTAARCEEVARNFASGVALNVDWEQLRKEFYEVYLGNGADHHPAEAFGWLVTKINAGLSKTNSNGK